MERPRDCEEDTMNFIVTGFDAFGEGTTNPSEQAVHTLPDFVKVDETGQEARVAKLTLPTCCSESWETLKEHVEKLRHDKFAILMAGLSGAADKICLERFALNVRQYRIPDNNGHTWDDDHINKDAPDALRTRLPIKLIADGLNNQGFACAVSNHAGSYVCNEIYFRALNEYASDPNCVGVLFIHVPPFGNYCHTNPEHHDEREPCTIYASALERIMQMLMNADSLNQILA